eukprot:141696_1
MKKLYPSLKISDSKIAVSWLFHLIEYEPIFIDGCMEIIDMVTQLTFIFYEGRVVRLVDMIATGWTMATNLANVTCLFIEYKTRNTWINNLFGKYINQNQIELGINLPSEFRYIDDIHEIWE